MKKNIIIGTSLALIIALVVVIVLTQKSEAPQKSSNNNQSPQNTKKSQIKRSNNPGTYSDYSEGALINAKGQIVLFFYSSSSPQSRSLEKEITKKGVPQGYDIFKVDYDKNPQLREKYGVSIQATFVKINESGDELDKYVAYYDPTLESLNNNFLND